MQSAAENVAFLDNICRKGPFAGCPEPRILIHLE